MFSLVQTMLANQFPEIQKFRNVHQLDYATSGIYVLALNKKAAGAASKLFRERNVHKTYLAIVQGHFAQDSCTVDQPIGDDPNHDFRMSILPDGKPAKTHVRVLERGYYRYKEEKTGEDKCLKVSKVELSPITGRRHQLRVHLQSLGHPIIGDYNYETQYTDTFRMMLHAYKIILPLKQGELAVDTNDPFINLVEISK
ncbi:pseudouridine synthase [Phycomyces blakesleeanus]|uniref:Pseudouridine synthase n=1 Tax=Phycomyces blakesleeanus TaxID=4837 RepID=A0ABR3B642_PHYBL